MTKQEEFEQAVDIAIGASVPVAVQTRAPDLHGCRGGRCVCRENAKRGIKPGELHTLGGTTKSDMARFRASLSLAEHAVFVSAFAKARQRFDEGVSLQAAKRAVERERQRVKLVGMWEGGSMVMISDTVEVYEIDGIPKAVYTNATTERMQEIALEEVAEYYGRPVSAGIWENFNSVSAIKRGLPEPSFDGYSVCELDGWAPELEE